jgi:arylsulfatase
MLKKYDEWGGPTTYPHVAAGWAVAGDSPFMWTKQVASNFGGTRNGMVVHWPKRVTAKGEIRSQTRSKKRQDTAGPSDTWLLRGGLSTRA